MGYDHRAPLSKEEYSTQWNKSLNYIGTLKCAYSSDKNMYINLCPFLNWEKNHNIKIHHFNYFYQILLATSLQILLLY